MTRASRVPQPTLDLSRRSLFGAVLGIGALATLQACGGDAEGGSGGDGGGTIKWAWQLPTTWDPVTSSAGSDVQMLALTYDALTALDDQGNAVAGLAETWKYDDDGTRSPSRSRPGLKFSDGTPLDADGGQEEPRARPRRQDSSLIAPQLADDQDVTADGDLDVVARRWPSPTTSTRSCSPARPAWSSTRPSSRTDADSLATQPAGSGPFTLTSYTQNDQRDAAQERQVLRRADEHQGRRTSSSTRARPGHRGRRRCSPASTTSSCSPAARSRRPRRPGSRSRSSPSLFVAVLDVNTTMAPFDDPTVVEALHYAIDREALIEDRELRRRRRQLPAVPDGVRRLQPRARRPLRLRPGQGQAAARGRGLHRRRSRPFTISTQQPRGRARAAPGPAQGGRHRARRSRRSRRPSSPSSSTSTTRRRWPYDGFAGRESPVQAFQVLFSEHRA